MRKVLLIFTSKERLRQEFLFKLLSYYNFCSLTFSLGT
jgi:hypothetical protein